jgi:hypothetical protein
MVWAAGCLFEACALLAMGNMTIYEWNRREKGKKLAFVYYTLRKVATIQLNLNHELALMTVSTVLT